jgi:RNA polymerase-binding protein DksA
VTDGAVNQGTDRIKPLPKTSLSSEHLAEFKRLLLAKRAELVGDVERLSDEAFNRQNQSPGEHSTMPIHMADLGTDNWEQDFTIGLIANERALVREIDEALARIEDRTYGVCLGTRKRITLARLRAQPWAKYCIEHARAREEGRAF